MTHLLHRIQSSHSQKRKVAWNKALAQHFDHTTNWKRTRGKAFFSGGCGFSRHKITNRATYRKDRKRPTCLWDSLIHHYFPGEPHIMQFMQILWGETIYLLRHAEIAEKAGMGNLQRKRRASGWERHDLRNWICRGKEQMSWGKAFFFFLKTFLSFTDGENRLVVALGKGVEGGMEWEVGVSRCKLLPAKVIHDKVLLYSTKNHIQHPNSNGKIFLKRNVYICIPESLCYTAEINTTFKIKNFFSSWSSSE